MPLVARPVRVTARALQGLRKARPGAAYMGAYTLLEAGFVSGSLVAVTTVQPAMEGLGTAAMGRRTGINRRRVDRGADRRGNASDSGCDSDGERGRRREGRRRRRAGSGSASSGGGGGGGRREASPRRGRSFRDRTSRLSRSSQSSSPSSAGSRSSGSEGGGDASERLPSGVEEAAPSLVAVVRLYASERVAAGDIFLDGMGRRSCGAAIGDIVQVAPVGQIADATRVWL